jgi:hypothetical protein
MSLVSAILTAVGYRIGGSPTISTTSDPTTAECIQWLNETALWITGICAENNSDLGRTIGTITTIAADISAATKAANCQITATAHGLITSGTCEVVIKDVVGMTELNDKEYTATYVSADALTLGIASTAYTTYTSGGYMSKRKFSNLATNIYAPAHLQDEDGCIYNGWIVDGHARNKLILTTEACLAEYDPVEAIEPSEFYMDGSNNVCFPSYPDDAYTVKIPYYAIPTALTATTDTVPFIGLMDNVFIEDIIFRSKHRDEYDTQVEMAWRSLLMSRVKNVIALRQKISSSVGF